MLPNPNWVLFFQSVYIDLTICPNKQDCKSLQGKATKILSVIICSL